MIRINLLPHREERRRRQNIQIAVLAGMTAGLAIVIVGAVHVLVSTQIDYQAGRNNYLKREITLLDQQIEEIKKLKEQTQQLLSRKKVVESLQGNRSDTVHVLDALARRLPDGVYLKQVKQTGAKFNLDGFTQSNARVSTLMRNLEESPWFRNPTLVEVKAVTVNKQRLSEFSLNVDLKRQAETAASTSPGAPKTGTAVPAGTQKAASPTQADSTKKPEEKKK
jgi:type IV pilus assembly protein PilN